MTSTAIFIWIIYTVMLLSGILIGKKLKCIAILLLLLNPPAGAQSLKNNRDIWNTAHSYIGMKIGSGLCKDMVDSALIDNNLAKQIKQGVQYGCYILNQEDEIKPGDIVRFINAEIGAYTYPNHIAIVYEVKNNHRMYIVHQNVYVTSLDQSKVVVTKLNLKKQKQGKVEFQRIVHL